jgi:hypothetical protein
VGQFETARVIVTEIPFYMHSAAALRSSFSRITSGLATIHQEQRRASEFGCVFVESLTAWFA